MTVRQTVSTCDLCAGSDFKSNPFLVDYFQFVNLQLHTLFTQQVIVNTTSSIAAYALITIITGSGRYIILFCIIFLGIFNTHIKYRNW